MTNPDGPKPPKTKPVPGKTGAGTDDAHSLAGQCLIAMPGMRDDRFVHSVIYLCAHSSEGAMGLIVNKPAPEVRFADLLEQLGIGTDDAETDAPGHDRRLPDVRVHIGGPVERGRGFVLHSDDYASDDGTATVTGGIRMTATLDVLTELAAGRGPAASMLALGYAGWGAGQLEAEIADNGWLTCPGTPDLVFGRAHEFKWSAALKSIKVDPLLLSSAAGRA